MIIFLKGMMDFAYDASHYMQVMRDLGNVIFSLRVGLIAKNCKIHYTKRKSKTHFLQFFFFQAESELLEILLSEIGLKT